MNIKNEINSLLLRALQVSAEEITPEVEIVDGLGADSLDCVELLMSAEEIFDIDISDAEAEKIVTVNDAVKFIETRKEK